MTDIKLKLSPPWVTYFNEIVALFGNDPDIWIDYNENDLEIKLRVDDLGKAWAISQLLPAEKDFGNVTLKITVIPNNTNGKKPEVMKPHHLFEIAFDRNPVFAFAKSIDGIFTNSITYVVFKNKVVQFFNDNLNDIHGNVSTLYQEIASDVFEDAGLMGVCYCTDIEEKVGVPLGEWP